jgi:hypothetical protein
MFRIKLVSERGLTSFCEWILTREKLKLGKVKLESYKSKIERRLHKLKMDFKGKEGEDPPMSPK